MPLEELWDLFSDYLFLVNKCFDLKVHSFVLMPNHFHLIARDPTLQLPQAMNYFMRETSRLIGKETKSINHLWGAPYHSSIIDDPLYYLHAYKYVYRNPIEARISQCPLRYKYSSLGPLLGLRKTILPLEPDDTLFASPEQTLTWLRNHTSDEDRDVIRKALRRKKFHIPLDPKTKKPNRLDEIDSVPKFLRDSIPELPEDDLPS